MKWKVYNEAIKKRVLLLTELKSFNKLNKTDKEEIYEEWGRYLSK